jgi:hypothetical protein
MIELLRLGRRCGQERLRSAVEEALAVGCTDSSAVAYILSTKQTHRPTPLPLEELGTLVAFERPLPEVGDYDRLLQATTGRSGRNERPERCSGSLAARPAASVGGHSR